MKSRCIAHLVLIALGAGAQAQPYSVDWHTIDGSGGVSTGAAYSLRGRTGSTGADILMGGRYVLEPVDYGSQDQRPKVFIQLTETTVTMSFSPTRFGYRVEATESLSNPLWASVPSSDAETITVPVAGVTKYFRLIRTARNQAPGVNAGVDQTIALAANSALSGTATDDGLPNPPSTLTTTWSQVSGPGVVTFGSPSAQSTTAAFSVAGTYVLRLTASDGALSKADELTVTVNPRPNQPPVVNAGPDQAMTLLGSATLSGTATDDGLPTGALTTTWSQVSGPGGVTFGNPAARSTTATFSVAGTYVLRLTASDGALSSADELTMTVNPRVNQAPTVQISLPSQGQVFYAPANVTIEAMAADSDGSIASVEFLYRLSGLLGRQGTVGVATSSPYRISWNDVRMLGTCYLTARAYDNEGALTLSSEVAIALQSKPSITASSSSPGYVSVQWTHGWYGDIASTSDGYELQESVSSGSTGFTIVYSTLGKSDHLSPKTYTSSKVAGTYWYRVRARQSEVYSEWSDVADVTVTTALRQITIINQMSSDGFLKEVIQVKVSRTSSFTHSDLLTDDPASCLYLPGESIKVGQRRTFDMNLGDNYDVFIGIGAWDLNNVTCSSQTPWFKRRFFTTPDWQYYYVHKVVVVNGHSSGNWDWTITGSYLQGTLKVTPQGSSGIVFDRTQTDPTP